MIERKMPVLVSFVVECDVPCEADDMNNSAGTMRYYVEEHSCPGTGSVGNAVDELVNRDDDYCWACGVAGENLLLSHSEAKRHLTIDGHNVVIDRLARLDEPNRMEFFRCLDDVKSDDTAVASRAYWDIKYLLEERVGREIEQEIADESS